MTKAYVPEISEQRWPIPIYKPWPQGWRPLPTEYAGALDHLIWNLPRRDFERALHAMRNERRIDPSLQAQIEATFQDWVDERIYILRDDGDGGHETLAMLKRPWEYSRFEAVDGPRIAFPYVGQVLENRATYESSVH